MPLHETRADTVFVRCSTEGCLERIGGRDYGVVETARQRRWRHLGGSTWLCPFHAARADEKAAKATERPVRKVVACEVLGEYSTSATPYRLTLDCGHSVTLRWRKGHVAQDLPWAVRRWRGAHKAEFEKAFQGTKFACPVCG